MQIPWTGLDHVTILLALGSPLFWVVVKLRKVIKQSAEDHRRITAMWQDHGYNGWDGTDRRVRRRQPEDSWLWRVFSIG